MEWSYNIELEVNYRMICAKKSRPNRFRRWLYPLRKQICIFLLRDTMVNSSVLNEPKYQTAWSAEMENV